jgi:hypothetical protein
MIDAWRKGQTPQRKADMDVFLRNLVKKSEWVYPDIKSLAGSDLNGLQELRWKGVGRVPHRIGGYFSGPDEFVMLIGWTHKDNVYDPPSAIDSLKDRRRKLNTGEGSLCEYQILTG